jgi:polyhydroxyalkanoate synthesis repressor PhaR
MTKETRLIKRYSNRKLYDTADKQYVTLEKLTDLIKEGENIQVVDLSTDSDITNQILTQLILEQGKQGNSPIPSSVLHDLIRWGEDVIDKSIVQVTSGIETMVHDSLKKFIPGRSHEVKELRQKVAHLESQIEKITNQ